MITRARNKSEEKYIVALFLHYFFIYVTLFVYFFMRYTFKY